MSSFFTKPASERKRKREDRSLAPAPKKRISSSSTTRPSTKSRKERDDSVSDAESEVSNVSAGDNGNESDTSSIENETAAEKRLRLAEQYLENIKEEVANVGFDAADIDEELLEERRGLVDARLKEDVAEGKGKVYRRIAGDYDFENAQHTKARKEFKSLTGVATSADGKWAYTVSKDMMIVKWELPNNTIHKEEINGINGAAKSKRQPFVLRKPIQRHFVRGQRSRDKDHKYQGHTNAILCAACSPDGKYLATGGKDHRLVIWDTATMHPLKCFTHHRGAVNSLAFRRGTNQLFSASSDRSVKVWSLDELAYIETLFGHQDEVIDVGALAEEKCVTVGARDRTARLWKVVEEQQLLFRGVGVRDSKKGKHKSRMNGSAFEEMEIDEPKSYAENTIDRVALLSHDMFVTGSSNGSLSLWQIQKKKPIFVLPLAHGVEPKLTPGEVSAEIDESMQKVEAEPQPRYITAMRAIPYSDLLLTGSWDGWIRCWRVTEGERGGKGMKIEAVGVIGKVDLNVPVIGEQTGPISGIINDLSVFERGDRGKDGMCVVAAVGPEHRLGRWTKQTGGKPAIWVFDISRTSPVEAETNGVDSEDDGEK
ncbi:WD40 repeat-like protein [Pseudovirgaria hyperparasitica]|uniref:WD40 repeat-like protein n=1 Tax=Pseudovirgaria hyperparasitica TaxID=470096 RepID=A0A6A6W2B6_9PEZI|nr:WD40 repeat-like protein [Pseudovirgaria hyperparasitica]KAF2757068.1 WD40 repeat-like protein [Pseudovirgaria hyperparasitica]